MGTLWIKSEIFQVIISHKSTRSIFASYIILLLKSMKDSFHEALFHYLKVLLIHILNPGYVTKEEKRTEITDSYWNSTLIKKKISSLLNEWLFSFYICTWDSFTFNKTLVGWFIFDCMCWTIYLLFFWLLCLVDRHSPTLPWLIL